MIKIEGLSFVYNSGTPYEVWALKDIDLEILDGEFLGLIGPTGSGKTTLIQHINGLLTGTKGKVFIDGIELKSIHPEIGIVFQSSEDQLFGRTVYEDMAIGYRNLGQDQNQFERRSLEALEMVGLSGDVLSRSPHSLSDGERRRAAIASILILEPKVLLLDEPTLGVDPMAAKLVLEGIKRLNLKKGVTVILITHEMEEIIEFCNRLVVMDKGKIIMDGRPAELFTEKMDILTRMGLDPPWLVRFIVGLRERGFDIRCDLASPEDACHTILEALKC